MTHRTGPNRAICDGDKARAGIGRDSSDARDSRSTIGAWSTPFLRKFLATCKSDTWRKEAHSLILIREGIASDLTSSNSKKARRKRGSKQAQSFGRALRVP